jgi:hypothetical protein
MSSKEELPYLYIFLDEGGNMDFSPNGTKYFTLTTVSLMRPFHYDPVLTSIKYDMIEKGIDLEYFHASEDIQDTRNRLFSAIACHLTEFHVDSLIIEKSKVGPNLQDEKRFYPEMLGYLLQLLMILPNWHQCKEIIVITDAIPMKRKRQAIEKAVKETLKSMLAKSMQKYRILHHQAKSCMSLQVADYCNWAIYRKWQRQDLRSYEIIKPAIRSEIDFFKASSDPDYFYKIQW